MNKIWAVGYINFFDNELYVEIIHAPHFKLAILKHSKINIEGMDDFLKKMPDDLESIKVYFYDNDSVIDVKEIL